MAAPKTSLFLCTNIQHDLFGAPATAPATPTHPAPPNTYLLVGIDIVTTPNPELGSFAEGSKHKARSFIHESGRCRDIATYRIVMCPDLFHAIDPSWAKECPPIEVAHGPL